jgi:signal transduction histidine kinase
VAELLRTSPARVALLVGALALGYFETQDLVRVIKSQSRLREGIVSRLHDSAHGLQPRLTLLLAPGGEAALSDALSEALRSVAFAQEAEIFDAAGVLLSARPRRAPVAHWLKSEDLTRVQAGEMITIGPLAGGARLLTYVVIPVAPTPLILRLATAAPDVVEDTNERQHLVFGRMAALFTLVFIIGAALIARGARTETTNPRALEAYAEAMELLRERGVVTNRTHADQLTRLQEQVQDKEAMARAGELTAGMVHEVRNGLGTIVGYARLLDRLPPAAEVADAARGIRQECETLEVIVSRFIEFVQRETLNIADFDLSRMLSRVASRESRMREGAEVVLASSAPLVVAGDEELLERAFENLVRNAREAAGPKGHVWLEASRMGSRAQVIVADDGPGFPREARDRLRPFYTSKPGGLGLGLPLVLKIVRLHGGDVAFEDRTPRGLKARVGWSSGLEMNEDVTNRSAGPVDGPEGEGGRG